MCDFIRISSFQGDAGARLLEEETMRFSGILDVAKGLDPKSLSRVLKYLASEDIVRRDVLSTQPVAVQYSLTEKGR